MKNLLLVVNAILALAVGFLLVQHFKQSKSETKSIVIDSKNVGKIEPGTKVMFVNADTLMDKYTTYKTSLKQLEDKQKNAENAVQREIEALQKEYVGLQERAQKGQLSQEEAEKADLSLRTKQEAIAKKRDNLLKSVEDQSKKLDEVMKKEMNTKLTELQKELAFDYVVSYSPAGQFIFVNPSLDITKQAIEALNKKDK